MHYTEGIFSFHPVVDDKLERNKYDKCWLVVKSIKTHNGISGYRIAEGDVLRMGRGKFRVKEINNSGVFEGNNLQDLLVDREADEESGSELDGSDNDSEPSDEEAESAQPRE